MVKAIWNGEVLAESDRLETAEGNVYFPPDALEREHFQDVASTRTRAFLERHLAGTTAP